MSANMSLPMGKQVNLGSDRSTRYLYQEMPGAIESIFNRYLGTGLTKAEVQQNAFNMREAEEAYNRQIDYYKEFQSPTAMVKQFEDAGINPALIAGQPINTPPSSQAASGSGGNSSLDFLGLISNLVMRNKELKIQEKLADAEVRLKNQRVEESSAKTASILLENEFIPALRSGQVSLISESINKMKAEVGNIEVRTRLEEMNISVVEAEACLGFLQVALEAETQDAKIRTANALARSAEASATSDEAYSRYADEQARVNISATIAKAFVDNASASQIRSFSQQYFENKDLAGRSAFQRMTNAEIEQFRSNIQYNDARREFTFKEGALVSAQKNYVDKEAYYYGLRMFNETLNATSNVVSAFKPGVSISTTEQHTTNSKGFSSHTTTTNKTTRK